LGEKSTQDLNTWPARQSWLEQFFSAGFKYHFLNIPPKIQFCFSKFLSRDPQFGRNVMIQHFWNGWKKGRKKTRK